MKSAAVREARQVARTKADQWRAERASNDVIAARLRIPRDVRTTYDRLNHRERGKARARWRRMIAVDPVLSSRRRTRRFRIGQNRAWNTFGVRMEIAHTTITDRKKFGPPILLAP